MTIHDDNATTWRDLADPLTPQQIAELEYCEREQVPPGLASPQHRLNGARAMSRENIVHALCADIAAPADSIDEPSGWIEWDHGDYCRMFTSTATRTVAGANITVSVLGNQYYDGRTERWIRIDESAFSDADSGMTAEQAHALSVALAEAADAMEQLQ
jgi:hypothetical protein